MTVREAYENVRRLNKTTTKLIKLGCKINPHVHPQQVSLLLDALKTLDKTRCKQLRVAQNYRKTAQRLGELRSWATGATAGLEGFSDIFAFEEES